jgi:hypothetical protein
MKIGLQLAQICAEPWRIMSLVAKVRPHSAQRACALPPSEMSVLIAPMVLPQLRPRGKKISWLEGRSERWIQNFVLQLSPIKL